MIDNEAASRIRQDIEKLVTSYKALKKSKNDDAKEMAAISEANVRADFIDGLFEILGWDIRNPDEYDREHFIRGAGFADVALKLDKKPVIFIEAKRFGAIPHRDKVKGDWTLEERQSILYAAGKNCKWAILTNFEKFRVFNALTGLTVLNFESVEDYAKRLWDLIHLTREFVLSEKIDKLGAREEKEPIDKEFLGLLNNWRIELANDIYRNNFLNEGKPPDLSQLFPDYAKHENDPKYAKFLESRREILRKRLDFSVLKDEKGIFDIEKLKSAVQRILDRLIIIRWAEDHLLLDDSNILGDKLKLWKSAGRYNPLYEALFADGALFDKFNDIHNGEIFKRGTFYDRINVSSRVLENIIEEMTSRSFRKFDFDVLGNTYETYLGNTLRLKEDNTFELKPSQEMRKESGIYYTPPYVVDYIVKNTVGSLLKDKTPEQVARIKVLDPACGSGSFLIKAYDCFANYYEEKNRPIKARIDENVRKGMLFETSESTYEGYEAGILMNNIHGVDLDSQAAEIAAVNLMLKALKAEEMLPPILGETIKVGNSLISGREEELRKYFGEEWRTKKPFNWEEEFADVFDKAMGEGERGFDVVIGNPPYINVSNLLDEDRDFLMEKYESALKRLDIYVAFIEKGIRLLKVGGKLSFIIPYPFLNQNYAEKLRKLILDNCLIEEIVDLSKFKIFEDATVRNIIIILKNESDKQKRDATKIKITVLIEDPNIRDRIAGDVYFIPQSVFYSVPEFMFRLELNDKTFPLIEKINSSSIKVGKIIVASWGARGVPAEQFHLDPESIEQLPMRPIDFSKPSEKSAHDDLVALVDRMLALNKQLSEFRADFRHYLNLRPHSMVTLRSFMDVLPVGDKEVLKDHFGKPVSTIKAEKFEAFDIVEEGDWLVLVVGYNYTGGKGKPLSSSNVRALRLRIPDISIRKFIFYSLKGTAPGKLGSGNILEQLQKLKIPRIVTNGEENRRAIEELMAPFLAEVAKKEALEREIKEIDDSIDKKVYALYGLTDEEIRLIEEKH